MIHITRQQMDLLRISLNSHIEALRLQMIAETVIVLGWKQLPLNHTTEEESMYYKKVKTYHEDAEVIVNKLFQERGLP